MAQITEPDCRNLNLDDWTKGIPVVSNRAAGYFIEACMVCFDSQNHKSGVALIAKTDDAEYCYNIHWQQPVTEELNRNYGGNRNKTTEFGAAAIALMLIHDLTEYTAVEEAFVGSTVDYFLAPKDVADAIDDTLIFNHTRAYCEIRGIRKEERGNTILGALRKKIKRLNTPQDLPAYIVIVEFGQPFSRINLK